MKVLLVDTDSTIPNLALMKLSAWHKNQGDQVGFNIPDPDIVYASVIFKKNKHLVDGLKLYYPDAKVVVGGSGYDLFSKLPTEMEYICPDYSLYDMNYSIGFTSRGCVRKCYFCIVPIKEGKYEPWQMPEGFVRHDKVKLLDNNWYANEDWFFKTSQWFIDHNVAVDVTQGMDLRLLTSEIAERLHDPKWWAPMHFAFDDRRSEPEVMKGLDILKDAGFDMKHDLSVYVYCHDNDHYQDAVDRCRLLKERRVTAYAMCNTDKPISKRMARLKRWTARPWIYWTCDIDDYDQSVKGHVGMQECGRVPVNVVDSPGECQK